MQLAINNSYDEKAVVEAIATALETFYGSLIEYKLPDRNKYLIKVDKWYPSSQMCHQCGTVHPEMKDLQVRKMICDCGLTISRDQNAAINILNEGLRVLKESA